MDDTLFDLPKERAPNPFIWYTVLKYFTRTPLSIAPLLLCGDKIDALQLEIEESKLFEEWVSSKIEIAVAKSGIFIGGAITSPAEHTAELAQLSNWCATVCEKYKSEDSFYLTHPKGGV